MTPILTSPVDTGSAGTWTVRVTATEIIGDGVLSRGDATDQDFALVVSNATDAS